MLTDMRRLLPILMMSFLLMSGGSLVAQDGTLRRIRVPILMYHYVGPLPRDADSLRTGLTVRPEAFRAQLNHLRDEGYSPIVFRQLYAALADGTPLPARPVILSFDDGYRGHFTTVFPLLEEYGYQATFFIISERADSEDPLHLSREHIVAMSAAGMEMGSHSRSHRELDARDRDVLVFELLGSRESLQAWTGMACEVLAWPYGSHDSLALQIAAEAGYLMAAGTRAGMLHSNSDRLDLARIRVNRNLTPASFAALLEGDWLREAGQS